MGLGAVDLLCSDEISHHPDYRLRARYNDTLCGSDLCGVFLHQVRLEGRPGPCVVVGFVLDFSFARLTVGRLRSNRGLLKFYVLLSL